MRVLTKCLQIQDKNFYLITDKSNVDGRVYYGTIPYTDVDENGKLKRVLCGFDMCISFKDINDAIKSRTDRINVDRLADRYELMGYERKQAEFKAIIDYYRE